MRSLAFPLLLLLLPILLILQLGSPCSGAGKVIYFNQLNTTESHTTQNQTGKGMLFDIGGPRCRRGFMKDHHGRCRRVRGLFWYSKL
ncbi:hypothetical protein KR009_011059 [Drosophila setifemur]|nr:hypothetical protein KR009_011059 [Drosophila setifemur]